LRAASGGESGWLVICCTANISILYRDSWFLMLAKLFRVASLLAFLFNLGNIADIHSFYVQCAPVFLLKENSGVIKAFLFPVSLELTDRRRHAEALS